MYILIVEDDKLQFNFIKDALNTSQTFSKAQIERIVTESEFQKKFEEIAENKPDAIILDIMLRWADPEKDMMFPPAGLDDEAFFRAGVRCEKMLAQDPRTEDISVILYSVLESQDLKSEISARPQVHYLEKDFNAKEIERILRKVIP